MMDIAKTYVIPNCIHRLLRMLIMIEVHLHHFLVCSYVLEDQEVARSLENVWQIGGTRGVIYEAECKIMLC